MLAIAMVEIETKLELVYVSLQLDYLSHKKQTASPDLSYRLSRCGRTSENPEFMFQPADEAYPTNDANK